VGIRTCLKKKKRIKLSKYKGFVFSVEVKDFMKFFQTDVNVYAFHEKENSYSKQHSYVCSTEAVFSLNVGLLDLPKYHHTHWLENVDSANAVK
jgi:hypothetical protein